MKYIYILLLTSLIMISCERSEPVIETLYCSPERVTAPCEDTSKFCYKGACITSDLKCEGGTDAPCGIGLECQRNEESREYECVEGRCRSNNLDGYCIRDGEACITGSCQKPCSLEDINGGCEDTSTSCFNGECIDKTNQCSDININGLCQVAYKCAQSADGHYNCAELCSKDFEEGPCEENDQVCVEGECLHTDNLCKDDDEGECPSNKTCVSRVCESNCSQDAQEGVCPSDDQLCVEGNCEYLCSVNHPIGFCSADYAGCQDGACKLDCGEEADEELDGYCEGVQWCADGYCMDPCDIEHKTGKCKEDSQWCSEGLCEFSCNKDTQDNMDNGVCEGENLKCISGNCVNWCSNTYETGACEDGKECRQVGQNYTCVEAACSSEFPTGYCTDADFRCMSGVCRGACTPAYPSGWCDNDRFCYEKKCKSSNTIPCSDINGTYCSDSNQECVNNICLLKPCAIGFDGRCEIPGDICITTTGLCEEAPMCSDYRIRMCLEGEIPHIDNCTLKENMQNSSTFGACCANHTDCDSQNEDTPSQYTIYSEDNRCVNDGHSQGNYCNKVGASACFSDNDCNDPYPTSGTEETYYCSIYDDIRTEYNISFCERVKESCTRESRTPGQACNETCGNSECMDGTYCIDGICTYGCVNIGNNSDCPTVVSNKQLECSLYTGRFYLGYLLPIQASMCRNTCNSNGDCPLSENECNNYFNIGSTDYYTTPFFSTCGKKRAGDPIKTPCTITTPTCSSSLCIEGVCSEPCDSHDDCGNGVCDYVYSKRVNFGGTEGVQTINYSGVCLYLASGTVRKNDCKSSLECPSETVTVNNFGRHYKCLDYTDSEDVVRGVCGIPSISGIPVNEGTPCSTQNRYCENDICINDNFEVNNGQGVCRELCSATSECQKIDGEKQICKRNKFRDGTIRTGVNKESYGGVCLPISGSPSLNDCSVNSCPSGETCILNPINNYADTERPWVFSVEYLCVNKNIGEAPLGGTCVADSDCESALCSTETGKCTIACTLNAQCNGVTGGVYTYCKQDYPAVYDDNDANRVYGGVCD